jgi:hypothetical protein
MVIAGTFSCAAKRAMGGKLETMNGSEGSIRTASGLACYLSDNLLKFFPIVDRFSLNRYGS